MIDWFMNGTKKPSKQTKDSLRDLFGIKPSHRAKPKSNLINEDFLSGFIGQSHPNPKDRKTKQQKAFLKKTRIGSGKSHMRFWDMDGDGVIAGLDCMPKNHKRHMARYLSTQHYGISVGDKIPHYDLHPYAYEKEVDKETVKDISEPHKYKAIRLSTEKEADEDSFKASHYPGEDDEFFDEKKKVVVRVSPSWEDDMEHKPYRTKFMKGIDAIQKYDKYDDNTPVYSTERQRLGDIGSLKQYYGDEKATEIYETKYIDTDKAYKMREKWAGPAGMVPKRSETTMDQIRREPSFPIQVSREHYEEGELHDGKHRLIVAKEKGIKNIPIQIERDDLTSDEVIDNDEKP